MVNEISIAIHRASASWPSTTDADAMMVVPPRHAVPPAIMVPTAPSIVTHVAVIPVAHIPVAHVLAVAIGGKRTIAHRPAVRSRRAGRWLRRHAIVLNLRVSGRCGEGGGGDESGQQQGLAHNHDEPPNVVARGLHRIDCAGATVILPVGNDTTSPRRRWLPARIRIADNHTASMGRRRPRSACRASRAAGGPSRRHRRRSR